jgi:hypothetical protein
MHPIENEGVLRFLGKSRRPRPGDAPVKRPDPKHDYYWKAGSHPEVVERVWDQLGQSLPADSRILVYGTPALAHLGSGIILAFALGTEYALRLPARLWRQERPKGVRTVARWARGSTDLAQECGEAWIFGSYAADEPAWCREAFLESAKRAR